MRADPWVLFDPDPDKPASLSLKQGILQSWDPDTGDNTVTVAGATLVNIPVLASESASLQIGDVVSLVTDGKRWRIDGKLTTPGDPGTVPSWNADITALDDTVTTVTTVTIPAVQADVVTAQSAADTAQTTADGAATDAATAVSTANAAAADAADALAAATSDGNPPASSPDAEAIGGLEIILARWVPVSNADPVTYEVHIDTTDAVPTAGDTATLAGTTSASMFTIKALPGDPPASPDDPDLRLLAYDTDYYVMVFATDADGSAAAGAVAGPVQIFQVTGPNIAPESIVTGNIAAGAIDADRLTASLILSGEIWTAASGQRTGMTAAGFFSYKSDESLMLSLPNDGGEALYDGELVLRRGTFVGGASLQSDDNEMTADSAMTLMRGIASPSATPQVGVTYTALMLSTASLSTADKTGDLGVFDLNPAEVTCIEWKASSPDYWVLHQVRSGGTRAWFFRTDTGAPYAATGAYFDDTTDWAYYSVYEITSGTHAGVYRMARWIPSGSANTYYMHSPAGLNRYSRQNGVADPAIGTDGSNIFTAEVIAGSLRIRYWVPNGDGNNLVTPTSTLESGQGFATATSLCTIEAKNFDIGSLRYAVTQRGVGFNAQMLNVSGTSLYPGGSGNNWASANKDAQSFESPVTNRRAMAWDASNSVFWTYGSDGYIYKHTSEIWDPAVSSSTYWARLTFYDSDSTGGTHETLPGVAKSYFAKRRALNSLAVPPIPDNGGTNDPDRVRLYMARGATAPANSSYHLQYTGTANTTWQTMATATANPPTSNNFPSANPAVIQNDDASLKISGDGSIIAASIEIDGDNAAVDGPYWYGYLTTSQAIPTSGTPAKVTGWSADGSPNSSGITHSSGNFTVPRAGRYRLRAQAWWAAVASPTGPRTAQWILSPSTTLASHTVPGNSATQPMPVYVEKTVRLSASDQVFVQVIQGQANGHNLIGSTPDITYVQLEWVGP